MKEEKKVSEMTCEEILRQQLERLAEYETAAYRGTNPYAVGGRQVSRNGNNESGFGRALIGGK